MLQYGVKITSIDDPLQKVTPERIYQAIVQPKPAFRKQMDRLRMIRSMDERQYRRLKRDLPYFVCGRFHPPYRRKENFAAIRHFVIDLDHLKAAKIHLPDLRAKLIQDERLQLLFVSPGEDGLKLLFRLSENCTDPGLYSLFYKAFQQKLALDYGLEQVIDARTHDVTRACFLSIDPQAFYRSDAQPIHLRDYFDPAAPDAQRQIARGQKELRSASIAPKADKEPLDDETLLAIKQKLNPNFRPRKRKPAYVPPELDQIIPALEQRLQELDIMILEKEGINYGQKLKLGAGKHWAALNIFFGQRGFSVVKVPQNGSHPELADLCYQAVSEVLQTL
jgi:hypothetical protein